ncbi:hypothetical protein ACH4OX_24465 [Streptomyces roseolus]|uniref:hypothetical protein n=1 Tax=Streptomyces roseolus TaxID=67358 RepID=UPI00379E16D0
MEAEDSSSVKVPAQRCWYFFSEDLPDGETMVPIVTRHGLAFAVRPGACPPEFLDRLNEAAEHVLGVGLAAIKPQQRTPLPEP